MPRDLLGRMAAPALPIAEQGPLKRYLDTLNNILRLFFNLITATINRLTGELGGRFLDVPNGLFYSTTDQLIAFVNTAQAVSFENTYLSSGVTVNGGSNTQITVTYSGIYNFQFVAQAVSTSASAKNVYVWTRCDGTDIGYSARHLVLSGSNDSNDISLNFNISMQAGSYIEMMWSSDNTDTKLDTETALPPHPGEPAAVIAITFVSALPDPIPTPP
jgi:hypothetical protein